MEKIWDEFLEHLAFLEISDSSFVQFLEGKVHRYNVSYDAFGWGVFPVLDSQNRIIDLRVIVPEINDEKTMLINIHEYVHAFDLYKILNQVDDKTKDIMYEKRAKDAEARVLERRRQNK